MRYYEIAPLTKTTNKEGVFTYQSDAAIDVGSAVKISIKNNTLFGIVIGEVEKPKYATKDIIAVNGLGAVIDNNRIDIARYISDTYFCSFGEALSAFFPFDLSINKRRESSDQIAESLKQTNWPALSSGQQTIFDDITSSKDKQHLIFGVTGSGKTEIYLKLVHNVLENGGGALILLPEISLTPQILHLFLERFPNNVAIMHSDMKETERYREWKSIKDGDKKVVVGTRSAIFAPINNIGIIIIDEFHENSYKQDQKPRYQTVAVAEKMSELSGAKLVLGSATPSVEKLFEAENNIYKLHIMNKRFIQSVMPDISIVDMRNEFSLGNNSIFSETLQREIKKTILDNKQVLLFINRRGMSTFVSCRECGYVAKCPACDIPLTFHYKDLSLRCHHCDFQTKPPVVCPDCNSSAIKYFGTGTQRVELELKKLIGDEYVVERMDKDTTTTRGSHEKIFSDFKSHKINILIGTQMITKGWDLANVGLVGIITADALINFPDYNAHERALSLMIQVAGRTGRGKEQGEVVVQTYIPELPIFKYLENHDFSGYYKEEIREREELGYPPFTKLIKMLYNNASEEQAQANAEAAVAKIQNYIDSNDINARILGPSPSFIPRLRDKYRWQLIIKISDKNICKDKLLREYISANFTNNWTLDADPNGVI